ncbi:MAG TPA: hypothetical protein VFI76_02325, partial [Terrimicrobiaceae bacterium]|nr:hypothetical protein [Terrimicrobiaceae bacterium]
VVITFFGSVRDEMKRLRIEGGCLSPRLGDARLRSHLALTSNGLTSIDPRVYDVFLVYGLTFRVPCLSRGLSRAVIHAAAEDSFAGSANCDVAALLRSVTNAPVYVAAAPMRAGSTAPRNGREMDYPEIVNELEQVLKRRGLIFVAQPARTVESGCRTRPEFTKGAKSLVEGRSTDASDRLHMNAEYGQLFIDRLIERVTSDRSSRHC